MDYADFFYPVMALLQLEYIDYLEIGFFSFVAYYLCRWLQRDIHKNLLGMFLTYYGTIMLSFMINLQTIFLFLVYLSPLIALLFIVFHQESLQKNFVTFYAVKPYQKNSNQDWLEILFRTLMQAIAIEKQLTIIIERNNSLAHYVICSSFLHLDLNSDALLLLIHSDMFDESKLCWINDKGILISINAQYNTEMIKNFISTQHAKHMPEADQLALLYSAKTDALIIQTHKETKLCSLWVSNAVVHNLTIPQGLQITKKYIQINADKDEYHDTWTNKKDSNMQVQS